MGVQPSSQEAERLLREFFRDLKPGFFVEVGVSHPTDGSPTWPLEQAGWTGVLVEPQPDVAASLVRTRTAKVFAAACSSPENADDPMTLYVAGPQSTLDLARMNARPKTVTVVSARMLDDILEEAEAPVPVDFVSIAVEGHELAVLQGFDTEHWQPRLIAIDDRGSGLAPHWHLKSNGYRLVRRAAGKGWYIPATAPFTMSWSDRWDILRSYYLGLPFRLARSAWSGLIGGFRNRVIGK